MAAHHAQQQQQIVEAHQQQEQQLMQQMHEQQLMQHIPGQPMISVGNLTTSYLSSGPVRTAGGAISDINH